MLINLLRISLVFALTIAFTTDAFAQSRRRRTTTDPYSSSSDYSTPSTTSSGSSYSSGGGNSGRMAASGGIGFYGHNGATITANNAATGVATLSGMFGIGGDFDYFMSDDMSVGGIFRYYSTSDTAGNTEYSVNLMTIGGVVKAYVIDTAHWAGSLNTGLGMVTMTYKVANTSVESGTSFGFYFGMSLFYKFTSDMAVGFENTRMLALGSSLNGWPLSDYMVKARFMF